jgi:hypothetical protein
VAKTTDSIERADESITYLPYAYINYVYDPENEGVGSWGNTLDTAEITWENFVTLKDGNTTLKVGGEGGVKVTADKDKLNGEVTFTFTYGEQSVDLDYNVYYGIANETQFYKMADDLTANYILTQDMSFTLVVPQMDTFTGTLNGNFKKISNVRVYTEERGHWFSGIFEVNKGTIKNLVITNGMAYGIYGVGVIAGQNAGKIVNCYVDVTTYSHYNGSDEWVEEAGFVTGENYVGGIAGTNVAGGSIKGCVFIGTVNAVITDGTPYAGGISGSSEAGWIGFNIYVSDAEGALLFGRAGEATLRDNAVYTTTQAANITADNYMDTINALMNAKEDA